MEDILILGAGGLAREVAFVIEEINRAAPRWRILGFVESSPVNIGAPVGKYTVVASEDELLGMKANVVIGIGNPQIIRKIADRFGARSNLSFPNLIHPNVIMDKETVIMGRGNLVCAGSIFTTNINIGSFNYFNLNCSYGHDIIIGDCCVFNPGINLSGGVKIGSECLLGTGATVLQYLNLGDRSVVGAGAVVTKNVELGSTVVGVPAKPLASKV